MRISVGIDVAKETHWVTALDDRAEDSKEVGHFFVIGGRSEMFLKFNEIEYLILRVTEPLSSYGNVRIEGRQPEEFEYSFHSGLKLRSQTDIRYNQARMVLHVGM